MAMRPLAGRHALVTGGSRGIGRACAAALVAAGATVTVLGRDERALRDVVGSGEAHGAATCDVTDPEAVGREVARSERERGPVGLLVANAGAAVSRPFAKTGAADFGQMFGVNVLGVVHAVQAVMPGMTGRGFGRVVAVASTAGLKGYRYATAYCAAKHAVVGLVRALAVETARTGVTVNAVCPGFTDTELVGRSLDEVAAKTGRTRDDVLAEFVRSNPQGRLVRPDEVADAVLWLCGEAASAVTGQAIAVAGGEV